MGEVFRARDVRLGREVAIKILRRDHTGDPDRLRRFLTEAKAVSGLNHPNILTLHEIGEHEGAPYIVTELVSGQTLRQRLAGGPLPIDESLDIGIQIAEGLARAHETGIIHRDVKPENVMLTADSRVKILDFGLAKLASGESAASFTTETATATGIIVGTPQYLSPEQLHGRTVDPRSDVFALGVVLYEMLTGSNPFRRDSAAGTLNAILSETPAPAHERRAPIGGATGSKHTSLLATRLSDVIARATEKDPSRRYADGVELAKALRSVKLGEDSAGRPAANRGRVLAVAFAGVFAVSFLGWWLLTKTPELPRSPSVPGTTTGTMPVPALPIEPPAGKTGVVVLPIRNESGAPELASVGIDRILRDMFVQILADAPTLYVIHPQRLDGIAMRLGRSIADAVSDEDLARTLATEAHAEALLSGTLSRIGSAFVLNATLTEVGNQVVLETFRAQAQSPETLLEELAGQVHEQMPESENKRPGSGTAGLPGSSASDGAGGSIVPSRSVDAYAHYLRGEDLIVEGEWASAVPELLKAVEIDPQMALAWSALSCAYSFAGEDVKARAAGLKARDLAANVNEQERRWIALDWIWVSTGNGDVFLRELELFIRDYPDARDGYFYGGLAVEWLKGDRAGALPWYEKAFMLLPNYYPVTKALSDAYANLGDHERAMQVLERYVAQPFIGGMARSRAEAKLADLRAAR
jgi:tetratricopeptide (TPR) repeat protein